jgi:hypothetical protein
VPRSGGCAPALVARYALGADDSVTQQLTRSLKKVPMTTTLTYIKAQENTKDRLSEARRRSRHVEVRRVAVIRPDGAHFKLQPMRASLETVSG